MNRVGERLAVLFALGVLLLNFPMLAVFNRSLTVGGIPVVYLYLFAVWAVGIAAVAILAGRSAGDEDRTC